MLKILYSAFSIIHIAIFVHGEGIYTVIAPGTLRSYFNYNVAITVYQAKGQCEIEIGLYSSSFNAAKTLNILPMSTENVEFELPKLEQGDYRLSIKGLSGISIDNSTELRFEDYNPLVYIQLDKPIYKPGDLVQFRVLFLNQKTHPELLKAPVTIIIKDSGYNTVQMWKNISLIHGVYTGNFQLSEHPMKDWFYIKVYDGEHQLQGKSFGVIKYDLPNFEVFLHVPGEVAYSDEALSIAVSAKYTFGKPVKGKATVSVELQWSNYHYVNLPAGKGFTNKTFPIDGKGYVEFNIWKDLPREELIFKLAHFPFKYTVHAFVEEELTGVRQYASSSNFYLLRHNFVMEAIDPPGTYEPGKLITYTVKAKTFNGAPLRDYRHHVLLNVGDSQFYSRFNRSGFATFQFMPPTGLNSKDVSCMYHNTIKYLGNLAPIIVETLPPERFQLNLKTQRPQLKEDLFVEIKWTEPIDYLVYVIVGRGNIIKVERVEELNNRQSYMIHIKPTLEMIPEASIFVHYIYNDNIRFEERTIVFENDFDNNLEISTTLKASPGDDIEFRLKTDPYSYVGLLGIDQSVLLFGNKHDLERDTIFKDLSDYKTVTPPLPGSGRYPGKISGLVSMTNAHFPWSSKKLWGIVGPPHIILPVPRKRFPETWIFDNFYTGNQTEFSFTRKIPDTITSWVITGFSMNLNTGFALTRSPTKIQVFKPFFISINLPNAAKQGEIISIPVLIYNYLNETAQIKVTMNNADKEFMFVKATNESSTKLIKHKRISIPSNTAGSVNFMIKLKNVGITTIKVTALTDLAVDSVHQKLKVEPEGVTMHRNHAFFISLKNKEEQVETISIDIPFDVVPFSEHIAFSAIGDIVGISMKSLENLVQFPIGYGEQNMINFVPSILVLKYLQTVDQKLPNVTKTALNMLKIGFQLELNFRHNDGSYSAYGRPVSSEMRFSEESGSTWLTAYVVRYFQQATEFIDIDQEMINESLGFLITKQTTTGNFAEFGRLNVFSHLNDVSLTAFVLLTFLENKQNIPKYEEYIKKGMEFLIRSLDDIDDMHSLSIAALVLQKVNHPLAHEAMSKLKTFANNENGLTWWSTNTTKKQNRKRSSNAFKSSDIEITAYVLQAMLENATATTTATDDILPIIKWLAMQRNSNGGFTATQDTVVGLQALIKFAEKSGLTSAGTTVIDYICEGIGVDYNGTMTIRPDNFMLLNINELPKDTRKIVFTARGNSSGLVQLSYNYNSLETELKQSFRLNINVRENTPSKQLIIDICAQFVPGDLDSEDVNSTNMVVIEVELPTGYTTGSEKLLDLRDSKTILFTETKKRDTIAVIYLHSLVADQELCISVEATKIYEVARQKPVPVIIYDYYDKQRKAIDYYEIKTSLCDICESDNCVTDACDGKDCIEDCEKSEIDDSASAIFDLQLEE